MQIDQAIQAVQHLKGVNVRATWKRAMRTRAAVKQLVQKQTTAVVRTGVIYDNIQQVQRMRSTGELPEHNAGLSWGEWVVFPYHIVHKHEDYFRLYPPAGIKFTPEVRYYIDGQEVRREQVEPLVYSGEFNSVRDESLCFNVKVNDLVHLARV